MQDGYSSIVDLLTAHGVHLVDARGDEKRANCLFHDDDKHRHMYVNDKDNLFYCHRCGEKGNGKVLARHFDVKWVDPDDNPNGFKGEKWFDKLRLNEIALRFYQEKLSENLEVYKYLKNDRGLHKDTIENARLGFAPFNGLIDVLKEAGFTFGEMKQSGLVTDNGTEFFRDKIIIPYLSSGMVVQLRGKQIGGKYLTPPGQEARLFGLDSVRDAEEVILCEGEIDALTLRQERYAALGLPGAAVFKEEYLPWFEGYRRIYLCFDNDEAGEAGAERAQKTLGKRTRIVKLPKEEGAKSIDVNELFVEKGYTRKDFDELLHGAEGRRLLRMGDVRRRWHDNKNLDDGIYLGLHPQMDHILQPGFQKGQLITMLAKTGAGKTVSMLNMAYQNRKNVFQIIVSLEQTAEEMYERLRRITLFYEPHLSDDEIDLQWQKVLICDENKLNGRDLRDLLQEFEEETGSPCQLLWVDYLGYFARGYKGEEYMRLSDAVMDLKAMAKQHRLTIFTPHQVNRSGKDGKPLESDMARGSGVIEETSDFCFALWKPNESIENDGTEPGEVKVRILKSRHGGKGMQFGMYQAPQSLAIVPPDNLQLRNMVMAEYSALDKGFLWEEIHQARKQQKIKPIPVRN